jgi:hypothetical protein
VDGARAVEWNCKTCAIFADKAACDAQRPCCRCRVGDFDNPPRAVGFETGIRGRASLMRTIAAPSSARSNRISRTPLLSSAPSAARSICASVSKTSQRTSGRWKTAAGVETANGNSRRTLSPAWDAATTTTAFGLTFGRAESASVDWDAADTLRAFDGAPDAGGASAPLPGTPAGAGSGDVRGAASVATPAGGDGATGCCGACPAAASAGCGSTSLDGCGLVGAAAAPGEGGVVKISAFGATAFDGGLSAPWLWR